MQQQKISLCQLSTANPLLPEPGPSHSRVAFCHNRKRLVQSCWSSFGQMMYFLVPDLRRGKQFFWAFCATFLIPEDIVRKKWYKILTLFQPNFCSPFSGRTYSRILYPCFRPIIVLVQEGQHFQPTIRHVHVVSLIVGKKYSRILYRVFRPINSGSKYARIFYHCFRTRFVLTENTYAFHATISA